MLPGTWFPLQAQTANICVLQWSWISPETWQLLQGPLVDTCLALGVGERLGDLACNRGKARVDQAESQAEQKQEASAGLLARNHGAKTQRKAWACAITASAGHASPRSEDCSNFLSQLPTKEKYIAEKLNLQEEAHPIWQT